MDTPDSNPAPNAARPPAAPARRPKRWLLIISLTINFLFVGMIAGAALRFHDGGPPDALQVALGSFARALEPDDRRAILRDLRASGAVRPRPLQERRDAMMQVVATLRAEPFVLDALRDLVERQRDQVFTAMMAAEDAVLHRISEMTQQERSALADRLEREIADRDGHRDFNP